MVAVYIRCVTFVSLCDAMNTHVINTTTYSTIYTVRIQGWRHTNGWRGKLGTALCVRTRRVRGNTSKYMAYTRPSPSASGPDNDFELCYNKKYV